MNSLFDDEDGYLTNLQYILEEEEFNPLDSSIPFNVMRIGTERSMIEKAIEEEKK